MHRTSVIVVLSLAVAAMAGMVVIRYGVESPAAPRVAKVTLTDRAGLVDEQPLTTAQKLATLALTQEETEFAQEAVRVADHEVNLTFTSALRNVTLHPPPLSTAAREILARVEQIQDRVKAEQADVARVKRLLAEAKENQKEALEQELQLEQAVLEVDQDDLEVAQQELIRAGGDPRSIIQRMMDQHDAWHQRQQSAAASLASVESQTRTEASGFQSVITQVRTWRRLSAKAVELTHASEEVMARAAELTTKRSSLEQEAQGKAAKEPEASSQGGNAAATQSNSSDLFSILKRVSEEQKELAELDKRVQDLQQLDTIYGNWGSMVATERRACMIGLLKSALWILAALLLVLLADSLVRSLVSRLAPQRKRLITMRSVARFAMQAIGVAAILLVIFGPPSQLATVVALAGAGLTVALKDFIVGFFGWFALMGPNGIRPGDWVEINGVGGEVFEVGLLHTILLETGNWSEAGHPTGRKVTLVNSFAIEGHYFNFSTSGQWLWDELRVPIPTSLDPYSIADAIQKVVAEETQAHVQRAEQEWERVVSTAGRSFSAAPTVSVRPTAQGVNVIVRYITRAPEQHEVRSRLYQQIVELLHSKPGVPSQPENEAAADPGRPR